MTHSSEAIAAYPDYPPSSTMAYSGLGSRADERTAFDKGRESRLTVTREALDSAVMSGLYPGVIRMASTTPIASRVVDAILAGPLRDEREVKAEALEVAADNAERDGWENTPRELRALVTEIREEK